MEPGWRSPGDLTLSPPCPPHQSMDPQPSQMPSLSSQTLVLPPFPKRMPSYHPPTRNNTWTPGPPKGKSEHASFCTESCRAAAGPPDPAQPPSSSLPPPPPHCHSLTPACSSAHRAGSTHRRALALAVLSAWEVLAPDHPWGAVFHMWPLSAVASSENSVSADLPLTQPHSASSSARKSPRAAGPGLP